MPLLLVSPTWIYQDRGLTRFSLCEVKEALPQAMRAEPQNMSLYELNMHCSRDIAIKKKARYSRSARPVIYVLICRTRNKRLISFFRGSLPISFTSLPMSGHINTAHFLFTPPSLNFLRGHVNRYWINKRLIFIVADFRSISNNGKLIHRLSVMSQLSICYRNV